ncbi:MAG: cytochrome c-type biogenesis protein CcmH, partial [Actinomycetota bacterium]|nr:cytochrome c-type biogenesis protein CcmH [Actinomycetota bacterium]
MTRRLLTVVAAAAVLGLAGLGLWRAAAPAPPATQAARVDAVAQTLRCPTCQGLSVADSPSKVADGMRDTIREQLAAGRSPDEVRAWFVDRYGPWILLSPSPAGLGWLVWLLPVVAVAGGAAVAFALLRRPPGQRSQAPDDLEAARQAVAAYGAGALSIPDSPAGERLESALALVEAVRADQASGVDTDGSERLALERVAAALTDRDHEQRFQDAAARPAVTDRRQHPADSRAASEDRPAAAAGTGRRPRVTGLRWAAVAGGFFLVLAGLLSASVSPRAAGDPPTGSLPQAGGQVADGMRDTIREQLAAGRSPDEVRAWFVD